MLKGRATIELTNKKTGEKKTIKHDNLITNLYKDCFQRSHTGASSDIWLSDNSSDKSTWDYILNFLSQGILLFDSNLEADPDKYHFQAGHKMVGRADNSSYLGADTTCGSYNVTESTDLTKFAVGTSIKRVWDFSTSQANGTIGSVCLCPPMTARIGAGHLTQDRNFNTEYVEMYKSSISNSNANLKKLSNAYAEDCSLPRVMDLDNDKAYDINFTRLCNDSVLVLDEVSLRLSSQSVLDGVGTFKIPKISNSYEIALDTFVTDALKAMTNKSYQCNFYGKYFYLTLLPSDGRILPDGDIITIVINTETKTATSKKYTNTTGHSIGYINTSSYSGFNTDGTPKGNLASHIIGTESYLALCAYDITSSVNVDPSSVSVYILDRKTGTIKEITLLDGSPFISYSKYKNSSNYYNSSFNAENSIRHTGIIVDGDIIYSDNTRIANVFNLYYDGSHSYTALLDCKNATVSYLDEKNNFGSSGSGRLTLFSMNNNGFQTAPYISKKGNIMYAFYTMNRNSDLVSYPSGWQVTPFVGFYPFVLFTINNLETPIEKSDEQTMKITYELMITDDSVNSVADGE